MQRFVRNENVARYRRLIAIAESDSSRDEVRHQTLLKLLAEEMAKDMFHETSLTGSARETVKESVKENVRESNKRQQIPASEEAAFSETVKAINAQVTDELFRNDIGIRGVNKAWLAMMRKKIPGRDVWMSGQQLVDERSGIVDSLIRTSAH